MDHEVIALQTRIKLGAVVWHDAPWTAPDGAEQPRDFFGRHDDKRRILENLRDPSRREPVVIQGERRMGKTSMLKLVREALAAAQSDAGVAADGGFAVLRLPDGGFIESPRALFEDIVAAWLDRYQEITGQVGKAQEPRSQNSQDFANAFRQLTRDCPLGQRRVVVMIDELDMCLANPELTDDKKSGIAVLITSLIEQQEVSIRFLVSTSRYPGSIEGRQAKSLLDNARLIRLKPFDRDDTAFCEMTRALVPPEWEKDIDDGFLERLHGASGGWPFFAKAILWYLAEMGGLSDLPEAIERAAKPGEERVSWALAHIYEQHFTPDEQHFIRVLACDGSGMALATDNKSVTALVARGYLVKNVDGRLRFRADLFRMWFKDSGLCILTTQQPPTDSPVSSGRTPVVINPDIALPEPRDFKFEVALSFAGTTLNDEDANRSFADEIARILATFVGDKKKIAYDLFHQDSYAHPEAAKDMHDDFYRHSRVVAVLWCQWYREKDTTSAEFDILKTFPSHQRKRIIVFRTDDRDPKTVWQGTYYFDLRDKKLSVAIKSIVARLREIRQRDVSA